MTECSCDMHQRSSCHIFLHALVFIFNCFTGLIPAPIIFGRLIDSSCRLWQRSASVSSISSSCRGNPTGVSSGKGGSCLLYDTSKFRLRTYGVAFGIKLIELTLAVSLYLLIRKRTFHADCVMEMELKDIQQKENGDMNGNTRMNNGAENKQLLQNNE
jgi:hypothetical protein